MTEETIEVDGTEVAPAEEEAALVPMSGQPLAVTPQVKAADLVARLGVIREAAEDAMQEGVDYGNVPGTDKPTLFKPGAEKLSVLFQLDVQLENEKLWGPEAHLTVISRATVFHAPSEARLGYGEGVCTTRERKYAYRKQERLCPSCGEAAVIKGKEEYGGGWLCWKKRDGCGAKFPDGAAEIESQEVGEIDNPDLPDLWNTVVKMAEKRARVDAVLAVTGASALFTQDMEDNPPPGGEKKPEDEASPAQRGAVTRRCNELAVSDDEKRLLFDWVGGSPLTKSKAGRLISLLKDSKDWADVWDRAGIPSPDGGDDLPVDVPDPVADPPMVEDEVIA